MLLDVVFSFNRAMQLDYFLRSTLERFKVDYQIVVIYHSTGEHAEGYLRLQEKYRGLPIEFLEREMQESGLTSRVRMRRGAFRRGVRLVRNSQPRDNFKALLESTLAKSCCEFVMFNTDDGFGSTISTLNLMF